MARLKRSKLISIYRPSDYFEGPSQKMANQQVNFMELIVDSLISMALDIGMEDILKALKLNCKKNLFNQISEIEVTYKH